MVIESVNLKISLIRFLLRLFAFFVMTYGLQACVSSPVLPNHKETKQLQAIVDLNKVHIAAEQLAKVYGTDQVLVVFDLDNTLLAMVENLGSDQWYEWQTNKLDENDPRRVPDVHATQRTLFYLGNMRLTQTDTAEIVMKIQTRGFPMIVSTARDANTRFSTYRELMRNNLSFRESAFGPKGGYQQKFFPKGAGGLRGVHFQDGIFFLAGQDKGKMLMSLFAKTGWGPPKALVFVDDKESNVEAVLNAFADTRIDLQVFKYEGELEHEQNFNVDDAIEKWCEIEKKLLYIQAVFDQENFKLPDKTTKVCEKY